MEQAPADGTLWEIPSVNIDATDSWSSHYACRRDVAARFGDIFSLPLAKRARDVLSRQVGESALVLEVGAGDRRMAEKLRAGRGGLTYESMDIDPCGNHDYSDLSKIDRQYDVIFAFEVVEHIDVDELGPFLSQVAGLVREGGSLVLSTPNTWYPPAYLRISLIALPCRTTNWARWCSGPGCTSARFIVSTTIPCIAACCGSICSAGCFR